MSEPTVDEERFNQFQRIAKLSALRGSPMDDDSCATCYYYLDPDAELAYCWHEKLQIMVGATWWCHYWEMPET